MNLSRKRSRVAPTLLLGAASFALIACQEEKVSATVFPDQQSCVASETMTAAECEASFLAAQAEHERVAPRYDEKALCEEEHEGECYVQQSSGGGSFFMPFMAGYLMSNALNSNQGVAAQPLYKNRSGFSTASGTRFTSNAGAYNVSPRAFSAAPAAAAPMSRATVRSTGGFGSARTGGGSFGG